MNFGQILQNFAFKNAKKRKQSNKLQANSNGKILKGKLNQNGTRYTSV